MDERSTHIILVSVGLALFGAAYALAPLLHRSWKPTSQAGVAAHRLLGWLGRHFWHGWALLMLFTFGWVFYTDAIMYGH